MKIQKIKFISFIAMMFMFIGSSVLTAQQQRPPRGQHGQEQVQQQGPKNEKGPKGPRIPNLTDAQKEQMKAIHISSEKQALPIKNQVAEKEARLKTLTTSEVYNENSVNKVIDEIGDLKSDLMKLKVSTGQEIKKILTDEQLVFFNNHIGKGKGPKGPGVGPRQGRGR